MERVIALDTYHVRSKRALKKGYRMENSLGVFLVFSLGRARLRVLSERRRFKTVLCG